ncbi:MAG: hypothetical protein HQ505_05155 [Nitrosopumilus sp.]|nr:hypothetical protein [Nitrosopumilus sp.]
MLGILASSRQESMSGLLEIMLREHPEVIKTLEIIRGTSIPASMIKGKKYIPIHNHSKPLTAM